MTIMRQLEVLRGQQEGCRLAAFADIEARIVLRSSSAIHHPQEYLDELCEQAGRGFALLDAAEGPGAPGDDILAAVPDEVRIFIRSADGSGDAVLCVCSSMDAAARIAAPARLLLASVTEEA